jgi:hypothetical protein
MSTTETRYIVPCEGSDGYRFDVIVKVVGEREDGPRLAASCARTVVRHGVQVGTAYPVNL